MTTTQEPHAPLLTEFGVIGVAHGPGPMEAQDEANLHGKDEKNNSHNDHKQGLTQAGNGEGWPDKPALSKPKTGNRHSAFKALGWLDRLLACLKDKRR